MGFRLRRFRPTVAFMTPTDDSQECQAQAPLSSLMSSSRHIFDLAFVNLANVGAIAI